MSGTEKMNWNYAITYVNGNLKIDPAKLIITVHDQTLQRGSPIPAQYELTITGFVNGETSSVLKGAYNYSTTYTPNVGAGTYPVSLAGLSADNYIIEYVPGKIIVQAPPPGTDPPERPRPPRGGGEPEPVEPPATVTTVVNGEVAPLASTVELIPEPAVPQAGFAAWALLNLILTLIAILTAAALIITYFIRRKEDKEEEEERRAQFAGTDEEYEEEEEKKAKKRLILRLLGVIAAIIAVILFLITQDMTLPLGFIDRWTIWHIIIVAATTILAFFSRKKYEDEEEEDEESAGAQA
jgi:flagellar basal body-associated protein FliL